MPRGPLAGRYLRIYPGEELPNWWDPNDVGLPIVAAYRAINSVGTSWPGGPTAYADTLVNLANPGTYDLIEGNGAVPWAANTGWQFVAAALKYFNTGLTPANDQSWSALVQVTGAVALAVLAAQSGGGARRFEVNSVSAGSCRYRNGNVVTVAPALANGNIAVCGNQGYRDGVAHGGAIGAWTGASTQPLYLGCYNALGAPANYHTGNVSALSIYSGPAAAVQAEIVSLVTAGAAL